MRVALLAERLEHAGVLLVHLWPEGVGEARMGLALSLADGALVCSLRARDPITAEEAGSAEVSVPLAGAAAVDLARAQLERGRGWLSVRLPCAGAPDGRQIRSASAEPPQGRDAVRERTGFDLRAASLRRSTRERAAAAPQLACRACRAVLVPRWDGRLAELPRAAAHELADVTCACENTGCDWRAFLPAAAARPATPPSPPSLPPAPSGAADGADGAELQPARDAALLPSASAGGAGGVNARAAGGRERGADGGAAHTLHGDHWLLFPRAHMRQGCLAPMPDLGAGPAAESAASGLAAGDGARGARGADGSPGARRRVFRGPAHVPGWASGLLMPRAPPSRRRRPAAAGERGDVCGPRVQEWALAHCAHCGTVVGAAQQPSGPLAGAARAAEPHLGVPEATAAALGLGGHALLPFASAPTSAPSANPGPARRPAPALGAASAELGGAEPDVPFTWFDPELTAHTHTGPPCGYGARGGRGGEGALAHSGRGGDGDGVAYGGDGVGVGDGDGDGDVTYVVLIEWRICQAAAAAGSAEAAALGGGCAAGGLGAALLAIAEDEGVGHFELWAAADAEPGARRGEATFRQGCVLVAVQVLGIYCAVLSDDSSPDAPGTPGAETAGGAAGWRDSLRLLFEEHSDRNAPALGHWRARAGGACIRRLRVLDDDLACAVRQLRASHARIPPAQRALCGMSVGHLSVTPFLS